MPTGNSDSQSSTTQQTSTSSTDARVGADNGAVVIQAGGQQNISFSPEVAAAVTKVVDSFANFSGGVVSTAGDVVNRSVTAQENVTNNVTDLVKSNIQNENSIIGQVLDFGKSALDFGKTSIAASPAVDSGTSAAILSQQNVSSLVNTIKTPLLIAAVGLAAFFIFKSFKK